MMFVFIAITAYGATAYRSTHLGHETGQTHTGTEDLGWVPLLRRGRPDRAVLGLRSLGDLGWQAEGNFQNDVDVHRRSISSFRLELPGLNVAEHCVLERR